MRPSSACKWVIYLISRAVLGRRLAWRALRVLHLGSLRVPTAQLGDSPTRAAPQLAPLAVRRYRQLQWLTCVFAAAGWEQPVPRSLSCNPCPCECHCFRRSRRVRVSQWDPSRQRRESAAASNATRAQRRTRPRRRHATSASLASSLTSQERLRAQLGDTQTSVRCLLNACTFFFFAARSASSRARLASATAAIACLERSRRTLEPQSAHSTRIYTRFLALKCVWQMPQGQIGGAASRDVVLHLPTWLLRSRTWHIILHRLQPGLIRQHHARHHLPSLLG